MRKPNTSCSICDKPLYRRPSDLKRSDNSYCKEHLHLHHKHREQGKLKHQRKIYLEYIKRWKNGEEDGMKGKKSISLHIRRYLKEKYDNKCQLCGWGEKNKFTGKVPLEIHHIDGHFRNNEEYNLQLLCPNCHSLTGTYKSLNNGNGR